MSDSGWDLLQRVGEIIAVGGFAIDLLVRILQIRGVISLVPTRESLLVGGIVTLLAAAVLIAIGIYKLYTNEAIRYHGPALDFLVGLMLLALAVTCFITLPESARVPHHAKSAASASRIVTGADSPVPSGAAMQDAVPIRLATSSPVGERSEYSIRWCVPIRTGHLCALSAHADVPTD